MQTSAAAQLRLVACPCLPVPLTLQAYKKLLTDKADVEGLPESGQHNVSNVSMAAVQSCSDQMAVLLGCCMVASAGPQYPPPPSCHRSGICSAGTGGAAGR